MAESKSVEDMKREKQYQAVSNYISKVKEGIKQNVSKAKEGVKGGSEAIGKAVGKVEEKAIETHKLIEKVKHPMPKLGEYRKELRESQYEEKAERIKELSQKLKERNLQRKIQKKEMEIRGKPIQRIETRGHPGAFAFSQVGHIELGIKREEGSMGHVDLGVGMPKPAFGGLSVSESKSAFGGIGASKPVFGDKFGVGKPKPAFEFGGRIKKGKAGKWL